MVAVFRVDDRPDACESRRRAGVKERPDLVRVDHVRQVVREQSGHAHDGARSKPRPLLETLDAATRRNDFIRQFARPFEAEHADAVTFVRACLRQTED
jgi:hypothetical protein